MSYLQPNGRFGRREQDISLTDVEPGEVILLPPPVKLLAPPRQAAPSAAIAELRTHCLTRLDPAAIAGMPSDRLIDDIERLISEIATERRVNLNAREQRQRGEDLVNDIPGHGPL